MRLSERLLPDERVNVLRGVGSGEALAQWMKQKDSTRPVAHLLLLEELSTLLRRAGWDGSLLIPFLTEAFDCPPKYEVPFRTKPIKVLKPTPNLFAGTTAEWFWKSMREEDIYGGFGNRLCYFAGEPGALISMPAPPDEAALQRVEEALDGLASIPSGTTMYLTPRARRCWDAVYRDLKGRRLDPLVAAMTKRTDVYALKLAMVYAGFEGTTPKITSEQINAAASVAQYGIACAEWIVGQQRPFSDRGRCEEAVLRTLDHSDLPAWKIHHRIGGRFSAEDQMRAIRALMNAGSLIEVKKTSRNTPILGRRGRRRDA